MKFGSILNYFEVNMSIHLRLAIHHNQQIQPIHLNSMSMMRLSSVTVGQTQNEKPLGAKELVLKGKEWTFSSTMKSHFSNRLLT